ncbi:MAG: glycosyltransferase [Saprospiraceae bacterium]|nr:glycosyltransferase [Saprospiraceae bacterium]
MQQFLSLQPFITPGKISVIRHGIDSAVFYTENADKQTSPLRFLYAGRFEEIKGVKLLCDAWQQMEERPDVCQLYLAGNWKETTTGRLIAGNLGNRRDVTFIEALPQDKLAGLYRDTHCLIIPSKWIETGPLVFMRPLHAGCDIITSDTGGQGELAGLHKNKSTVFSSGDKNSLYQAIVGYKPSEKENDCFPITEAEHFERLCHRLAISSD